MKCGFRFCRFFETVLVLFVSGGASVQSQTLDEAKFPNAVISQFDDQADVMSQTFISQAPEDEIPFEKNAILDSLAENYQEVQAAGGADAMHDQILAHISKLQRDIATSQSHVDSVVFKDYVPPSLKSRVQSSSHVITSNLDQIESRLAETDFPDGNFMNDVPHPKGLFGDVLDALKGNINYQLSGNIVVPNDVIVPIWLKSAEAHFAKAAANKSDVEFQRGTQLVATAIFQMETKPEGFVIDVDKPLSGGFADSAVGDAIRTQMESDFGKEIFRAFWEGQTSRYDLSETEFSKIMQAVNGLDFAEQEVTFPDGSKGKRRDYSLADNFEYSKPLGSVAVYYDQNDKPVGFYDTFDFNWKWQGRNCIAEIQNRIFDMSGKAFGAHPFQIVYGLVEENPERDEPWYNRSVLPYVTIPDDCMAQASQALFPELWPQEPIQLEKVDEGAGGGLGGGGGGSW